jgi:cytochrome c
MTHPMGDLARAWLGRRTLHLAVAAAVLGASSGGEAMADAARGRVAFDRQCGICHAVGTEVRPAGPNLRGVIGRKAGSGAFTYSTALVRSNFVWTSDNLNEFLTRPTAVVPGTSMVISVLSPEVRRDLISYLATLK